MDLLLALAAAIVTTAALLGLVALLRRWVRVLGLLAFPLVLGSVAIGSGLVVLWIVPRLWTAGEPLDAQAS